MLKKGLGWGEREREVVKKGLRIGREGVVKKGLGWGERGGC